MCSSDLHSALLGRDADVAEFYDRVRIVILEADKTLGAPIRDVVDDRFAIKPCLNAGALGGDASRIPLARGFRHVLRRRDDVIQRAGGKFFGFAAIVVQDLHFMAGERWIFFEPRSEKHAAVAFFVDGV